MVRSKFDGVMDNHALIKNVASILSAKKGYTKANTLLATSLCCDEASRQLEDDFEEAYGRNFNLGGLAGFPWAGQTGFGATAHHIPEDGNCIVVYGPHVGITRDGVIGKVEREGIACPDTCCGSAVAASNYVKQVTEGSTDVTTNIQPFTDFQQGAVQQMMLPHCKRLNDAEDRMKEIPYAMYDSQDLLMRKIAELGASHTRNGVILLGGIQINTGPKTLDYFHPLRFSYMDKQGNIVEDLLPELQGRILKHTYKSSGSLVSLGNDTEKNGKIEKIEDELNGSIHSAREPTGVHGSSLSLSTIRFPQNDFSSRDGYEFDDDSHSTIGLSLEDEISMLKRSSRGGRTISMAGEIAPVTCSA